MKRRRVVDRSTGDAPFIIVTGSIGPHFQPKTFRTQREALGYAKEILAYGKANDVWPEFQPWLEDRHDEAR